jgi:hypothetical protein
MDKPEYVKIRNILSSEDITKKAERQTAFKRSFATCMYNKAYI